MNYYCLLLLSVFASRPILAFALTPNQQQTIENQYQIMTETVKKQSPFKLFLPIETPGLSVGDVPFRMTKRQNMPQPIFLIGADSNSIAWLKRHRRVLRENRVLGWIVQADTVAEIERIKKIAGKMLFITASGQIFAERYGIKHYPVLITPDHVEQ